jgi:hypothetical protein
MKKKYLILFLGLAAMLTFTACDPKPDLDLDKELKFSPLTVEQQKQKIEDNALVFVDQTEGLLETPAFVAIENFAVVLKVIQMDQCMHLYVALPQTYGMAIPMCLSDWKDK